MPPTLSAHALAAIREARREMWLPNDDSSSTTTKSSTSSLSRLLRQELAFVKTVFQNLPMASGN